MKKIKLYILMLLVPFIVTGCVEKGTYKAVATVETVAVNGTLAEYIYSNYAEVMEYVDDVEIIDRTKISSIGDNMIGIYNAYKNGGVVKTQVDSYYASATSIKDSLLQTNNWLTYNQMKYTLSKIQLLPYSVDADLVKSSEYLEEIIAMIAKKIINNSYYIEIPQSDYLNDNLSKTGANGKTYKVYLKEKGCLVDASITSRYLGFSKLIQKEIDILENTGTISTLSKITDGTTTDKYHITVDVMPVADKQKLIDALKIIKVVYANSGNYTIDAIIKAEAVYYYVDTLIFETIKHLGKTYYLVDAESVNQFKLDVGVAAYGTCTTDLLTILEAKLPSINNAGDSAKLARLIKHLKSYIGIIELYEESSQTDMFSRAVKTLQLYQLLIDNKDFIYTVIN